jgi:Escherichia/Staphylococcus phage prohead protease
MRPDLEYRSIGEIRADQHRIVGHAIVFDTRSRDLGGFVEVVRSSAVDRALAPTSDVVALYNHDLGAVLGRTPATLHLAKDARGLTFSLEPADTQTGRDTAELVRRGDLKGASFGFVTRKDSWSQDGGQMIRELLDIDLAEISLTAFPAYPSTDVTLARRSLEGWQSALHAAHRPCVADLQRRLHLTRGI